VQEGQRPGAKLDEYHPDTSQAEERERRPAFKDGDADRLAADDIVNDDLQGPGLQEFEPGDQETWANAQPKRHL